MSPAQLFLWLFRSLALAASAITAVRLYRNGLHKVYPSFLGFLVLAVWRTVALAALNTATVEYLRAWIVTEPMFWLSYVLILHELCGRVLDRYRGIRSLARWASGMALAISAAVTGIAMTGARYKLYYESHYLHTVVAVERTLATVLVVFLFLLILFALRYPLPLNRNLRAYGTMFFCYFLAVAAGYSILSLVGRSAVVAINLLVSGVWAGCSVIWLRTIRPEGEAWPVRHPEAARERFGEMEAKLEGFNRFLIQFFSARESGQA
jgi:hypothetical protein